MSWLKSIREHLPALILLALVLSAYLTGVLETGLRLEAPEAVALTILLITAILWVFETIPLYISSLGVLLMSILWLQPNLEAADLNASKDPYFQAFFSDITLLFMGGFVLSSLLNKYGIANRMARWVLKRAGATPATLLVGIIAISALLSMWMSNTATAAMMFAMISPVIMGLPDTSPFTRALTLSIPFACNLGGLGTPIGTPPNAIALEYLEQAGFFLSFIDWMLVAVPIMLILLVILWRLLLQFFPPGDLKLNLQVKRESAALNRRQMIIIGLFGLTVIGWMTTGLTGLSSGTIGLMIVIAAFGLKLLNTRDFRAISWDILFMLGGGLCLGAALNQSGLSSTISGLIPVEQSYLLAFSILLVLGAFMTTFMSNTATANLLIPIAVALPQGEIILALAISMICSSAMAMPVSTPPNAIAYGSGMISTKDMMLSGGAITLIGLVLVFIAGLFFFPLFAF